MRAPLLSHSATSFSFVRSHARDPSHGPFLVSLFRCSFFSFLVVCRTECLINLCLASVAAHKRSLTRKHRITLFFTLFVPWWSQAERTRKTNPSATLARGWKIPTRANWTRSRWYLPWIRSDSRGKAERTGPNSNRSLSIRDGKWHQNKRGTTGKEPCEGRKRRERKRSPPGEKEKAKRQTCGTLLCYGVFILPCFSAFFHFLSFLSSSLVLLLTFSCFLIKRSSAQQPSLRNIQRKWRKQIKSKVNWR